MSVQGHGGPCKCGHSEGAHEHFFEDECRFCPCKSYRPDLPPQGPVVPDPDPFSVTVEDVYGERRAELEYILANYNPPHRAVRLMCGDAKTRVRFLMIQPGHADDPSIVEGQIPLGQIRLIVEPLPKPKRKEIVFVEDENGEYISDGDAMFRWNFATKFGITFYRREEREVES